MGLLDLNDTIPIEQILEANGWRLMHTTKHAKPHKRGLYYQELTIENYTIKVARLNMGRFHKGNYYIYLDFWPKGYRYVSWDDRYFTLRKNLMKINIMHYYEGNEHGQMRVFYARPGNESEILNLIDDATNKMYTDFNALKEKYKGKDYI